MGRTARTKATNPRGGAAKTIAAPRKPATHKPPAARKRAEPARSARSSESTADLDITIVCIGGSAKLTIVANGEVRYSQVLPKDKLGMRAEIPVKNALAAICRELEAK